MLEELRISEARPSEETDVQSSIYERRKSLSSFPSGDLTPGTSETMFGSKPIADLFPSVTIMQVSFFCVCAFWRLLHYYSLTDTISFFDLRSFTLTGLQTWLDLHNGRLPASLEMSSLF